MLIRLGLQAEGVDDQDLHGLPAALDRHTDSSRNSKSNNDSSNNNSISSNINSRCNDSMNTHNSDLHGLPAAQRRRRLTFQTGSGQTGFSQRGHMSIHFAIVCVKCARVAIFCHMLSHAATCSLFQ